PTTITLLHTLSKSASLPEQSPEPAPVLSTPIMPLPVTTSEYIVTPCGACKPTTLTTTLLLSTLNPTPVTDPAIPVSSAVRKCRVTTLV
ncbi:hypothetical protein FBU59_002737, partial [Linderina macrospora]